MTQEMEAMIKLVQGSSVDKETPMRPLHISLLTNPPKNIIVCGKCKLEVTEIHKYCSQCGQKIDWSDEE